MAVKRVKHLQDLSVRLERHKILVLLGHILDQGSVSTRLLQQVFAQVVGQNQVHFVKSNNVLQIDVVLYQGVVHWHVLLELVKEMLKILAQVGHV